ncbi:MAG: FtsX-like permease family protein [Tahibacter sp.]
MEIRPILSALMRSKIVLILIGLQIALTLAIVCNASFIIVQRFGLMARPSGMDEANTLQISSLGMEDHFDVRATIIQDLQVLRGLPGVADVATINRLPMGQSGWSTGISLTPDQKNSTLSTAVYMTDEHAISALGASLIAGRNFRTDEIEFRNQRDPDWPPGIIITRAIAERLFPGQEAVGKQLYLDQKAAPNTVIGVLDRLQAPWLDSEDVEYSILAPQIRPYGDESRYVVRAEPGRRDEVYKAAEAKLDEINHDRLIRMKTVEEIRLAGYRSDRMMATILALVIASLLAITALGIVGMASFWVAQRTRQIGTRRALGASRRQILRYFQTENFVITSLGLLFGSVLAYAFNAWMIANYEAVRLPWYYLPAGFVALWTLGQIAVLGPATRASRIAPATATRSV